jgi:hypothetical protein
LEDPESTQSLNEEELRMGELLSARRRQPSGHFRGGLGRRLTALDPGWGPRPKQLRLIVGAYFALGLLLVGLGALVGLGVL